VNVITLASRMIARRRRMILRSAIPIGVAAFASVLVVAVLTGVGDQVRTAERVSSGELALRRQAAAGTEVSEEWLDGTLPEETLVSRALIAPAIVSGLRQTELSQVWFTDLEPEILYRNLPVDETPSGAVIVAPGDGGTLTPGESLFDGGNDWTNSISVTVPGADPLTVPMPTLAPSAETTTLILVDRHLLPAGLAPDTLVESVRIRGRSPMKRSVIRRISGQTGLTPTAWRSDSQRDMRELVLLGGVLLVLLFVTGGTASAPSVSLLVTRYRSEFDLLAATGYPAGYLRRLVSMMGSVAAAVTGTFGATAAVILVAVVNIRGGFSPLILPIDWLERNPVIRSITPSPPVWPALVAIGIAAAVGAIAALPASRWLRSAGDRIGNGTHA